MLQFTKHQNERIFKSHNFELDLLTGESLGSAEFSTYVWNTADEVWDICETDEIIDESFTQFENNVIRIFFVDGQAHDDKYRVVARIATTGLTPVQTFVLVYELYIAQDEMM